MNVLVVGAAGKTGNLIVQKAVAAGHLVTALVRDASKYRAPAAAVRVASGDATDVAAVANAMAGQDAVIDTVGGKSPWKKTALERTVAAAILQAMQQHGVRRLVAIYAIGVGDSVAQSPLMRRLVILRTFLRGSTADKAAMDDLVRRSGVEYVLIRPAVLNDNAPKGSVRVFTGKEKAHQVTRADVAAFTVDQLLGKSYLNQTVTIANA